MNTLWGEADSIYRVDDNCFFVTTPSHGGVMCSPEWASENLSGKAQSYGVIFGKFLCYEEDCLISIVIYEKPELFDPLFAVDNLKDMAKNSIARWYPEFLATSVV